MKNKNKQIEDKSRRSFTITIGLTTAGAISGLFGSFSALAQDLKFDGKNKIMSFTPSLWVEIREDNTTVVTISRTEMGQGIRTAFAMIASEELEADWEKVSIIQAPADSKYGNQSTGGSTSIRNLWQRLRIAGAQARMMLISAAALTWGISTDKCRAEKSYVYEIGGGRKISYAELIEKASTLAVPPESSVKLKSPEDFKIIGKTKWHIDNPDIVTGKTKYSYDVMLPGMLYAVPVGRLGIGATVDSFDDSQALKVKGVVGVYRLDNDIVAVGENSYAAFEAASLVQVEWNPGQLDGISTDDIRQAYKNELVNLPDLPQSTVKQIESIYEVPFLAHATMEPMAAVADYKDSSIEIWAGSQSPQEAKSLVQSRLGISNPDKVKFNVMISGGGFGRRHYNSYVILAARLSQQLKKPVRLMYSRSYDMQHDYYRTASMHALKCGIDSAGKPSGWIHKTAAEAAVSPHNPLYRIPKIENLSEIVPYGVPLGVWRSVTSTQLTFAHECFIDEIAHLAGVDPYIYRRDLITNERLLKVIDKLAEKSDWNNPLPKGQGRGIALYSGYEGYAGHVIEVTVDSSGILKVNRVIAAVDPGIAINPGNIQAQFMGAAIDGLSTAIKAQITIKNGAIQQNGFNNFEWLTMRESPPIEVHIIPSGDNPSGIGELGFPSVTPALCNAIFAACGVRVRRLPVSMTSLVSVAENANKSELPFKTYPEPFENKITIEFNSQEINSDNAIIEICDVMGKKVAQKHIKISSASLKAVLELSGISAGAYILMISVGDKKYSNAIHKY